MYARQRVAKCDPLFLLKYLLQSGGKLIVISPNFQRLAGPILCVGLALIGSAYWPGLGGPFLFDDYANLNVLGAYGQIDDWTSFLYYITSGTADPTGRPLALLTFLLDANTWPAAPLPFKRTNLVIHLVNTALLSWVLARMQAGLQRRHNEITVSPWTPILAALIWGSHPFFVSTTLYVVQREAMLPMTFVLLALLAWDRSVQQFGKQQMRAGWFWALVGMGTATLFGGLSKANGFLAPALAGLAYLFFLRPQPMRGGTKGQWRLEATDKAAALCLAVPTLLIIAYLIRVGWQLWPLEQLGSRDWTLAERLLSQPRALWAYVSRLALPRAGVGGLYVDDFMASRGWLDPATTLPALAALLASLASAIAYWRRFPILCFAWLFFLTAHLLESTTIPLELYFEHRNYMPAAFLGWPLAHALIKPGNLPRARLAIAATILGGLLILSHQRALVWGNEALFNALSAEYQANSPRSQVNAARSEIERGNVRDGLARIKAIQRRHPESVHVAINAIGFECEGTGALATSTLGIAHKALTTSSNWNYGLYEWMQRAASDKDLMRCRGFGLPGLKSLVSSAESNPRNAAPERMRDLKHVRGRIALAEHDPELALRFFDAALDLKPAPEYALVQAAALGDAGAQALGVRHLDHYLRIEPGQPQAKIRDMASFHAWLLHRGGYFQKELSHLHERLQADSNGDPIDETHLNARPVR